MALLTIFAMQDAFFLLNLNHLITIVSYVLLVLGDVHHESDDIYYIKC